EDAESPEDDDGGHVGDAEQHHGTQRQGALESGHYCLLRNYRLLWQWPAAGRAAGRRGLPSPGRPADARAPIVVLRLSGPILARSLADGGRRDAPVAPR
ncbi:hypothetical protein B7939_13755, partial [Eggerthia catenaformis]